KCAAPHLCLGTALVPARAWSCLFDRLRIALGPSGWTCRQQRDISRQSIPASSSRPSRPRRLRAVAYTMLVQFKRSISAFSVRQRSLLFGIADLRNRSRDLARCSFRLVLVADNRRTSVFQFSMGRPFVGDGLLIDLFGTMAAVAKGLTIL